MTESINVFISGDFAPTYRVLDIIQSGEYQRLFNDILPIIKNADIALTNLELPLIDNGTPIKKTGPNLKAPVKSIEALKFAGFTLLTLANNHIMDYGYEGLKSTIAVCKNESIDFIGVGENLEDAQKVKYISCKGALIAFINVSENEWSTTLGGEPGASPLNEICQYYQICEAKKNANHVILIVHGGHETYSFPSPRMKRLYRYFIDLGADAVIGHHTHCFSGHEMYNGRPIIYSLGNFIFDHPKQRENSKWNIGCAVILELSANKIDFELIPFLQCDKEPGVSLLDENRKSTFLEKAEMKASFIQNDDSLAASFEVFSHSKKRLYLSLLEPLKNRYLLAAINRGLFPRLINKVHRRMLLNLIKAESHREILMSLLKEQGR